MQRRERRSEETGRGLCRFADESNAVSGPTWNSNATGEPAMPWIAFRLRTSRWT